MANFIEPILATKKRPRGGLTTVASRLPGGADWREGTDHTPEGCTPPGTIAVCGGEKDEPVIQPPVHFDPFFVYYTDGCNDPWTSQNDFIAKAGRQLELGISSQIARELMLSTVGNIDLAGTAQDASGGAAVPWTAAITALIYNMRATGYPGIIWLHAPDWLQASFLASRAGQIELSTGLLYSGSHPAIFDAGYSGLVPPAILEEDEEAPVADPGVSGWVYATSPVEWDMGSNLDDVASSMDIRSNSRMALAERPAIVRFDPCHVWAALVDSTCAC